MEQIISVGIDIGTTTTQVIFSRLTIVNTANAYVVPRIEITDKELIYQSPVHFTPLLDSETIDVVALKLLIQKDYLDAGITFSQIHSGALIVTGETSRKENAQRIAHYLADMLGPFVVATAGADYEALLAGHGSGAQVLSRDLAKSVVNFDIGGGTTNACVFSQGSVVDCYGLDIGGRLIRVDEQFKVTYVSHRLMPLIESLGLTIHTGQRLDPLQAQVLCQRLAAMFLELIHVEPMTEDTRLLFIQHGLIPWQPDFVTFSGGVARYIYEEETCNKAPAPTLDPTSILELFSFYGDMGPLLGRWIKEKMSAYADRYRPPKETIRATVIGAGSHAVSVSGSTIVYDTNYLPMKNIPILKLDEADLTKPELVRRKWDAFSEQQVAIAIKGQPNPSYDKVKQVAGQLITLFEGRALPLVILLEADFAKALGQTIHRLRRVVGQVICLDGIEAEHMDYIDIGHPIQGVIPVVIKTLIFK